MSDTPSIFILNTRVHCIQLDQIALQALEAIKNRSRQIHISCANAHSLITSRKDEQFQAALNDSDIVVADGSGITMFSALLPGYNPPRITGHDFFNEITSSLNKEGKGKVFFFGSSNEVLDLIKINFATHFPNLEISTYSPPYREWSKEENEEMIDIINAANADVLWVGMTAPKQEKWVFENRKKLNTPVIGSIGAVFDFFAGTQPRAPSWIRKIGMEWLYRTFREPKRMGKRNLISVPLFIIFALHKHFLKPGK